MKRPAQSTSRQPVGISVLVVAVLFGVVTAVHAQTRGTGGLFGATRSDETRLSGLVSLSEMVESELPEEVGLGPPGTRRRTGGKLTLLTGSAGVGHSFGRAQIAATAETAFRYDDRLDLVDAVGHSVGLGVNVRLPRRSAIRMNQTAAYSPSPLYTLFPSTVAPALGASVPVEPEYSVVEAGVYRYESEAEFAIGSISGTRVSMSGTYDRRDFQNRSGSLGRERVGEGDLSRVESQSARVQLSRGIRRNLSMSAEYQYRRGRFGVVRSGRAEEQRVTIGVNYSRPFSGGRRLNLSGSFAPSAIDVPANASIGSLGERRYRVQGDGRVEYLFQRTWRLSSTVRRSAEYLPVLGEPILSDAGAVALAGLLTRRLDLQASAAYANGASVIATDRRLVSYTGTLRLRFAIKRSIAAFGQYRYHSYDLRNYRTHIADLPTVVDQQSISVGITLWGSTNW